MSRQRIHWDTRERDHVHRQKLLAKIQKIQGLKALLEMWDSASPEASQNNHKYILRLRARLRSAENQLAAMKP
jgi:hypothetical protein